MKKKAMIVGDFRPNRMRTEVFVERAFSKALKWGATAFSYREMAARSSARNMNAVLEYEAARVQPDLVLVLGGELIDPRVVRAIRDNLGATVAMWYFDQTPKGGIYWRERCQWYDHAEPDPWMVALGRECDAAFFVTGADPTFQRIMAENGVNSHHLLQACDPVDHGRTPKMGFKDKNLIFIGELPGAKWYRRQVVDGLGAECHSGVFGEDRQALLARSKINLNVQFVNTVQGALSTRHFAGLASGTMNLCHYVPGMEKVFRRGEHLDWFESIEEGRELVAHYVEQESKRQEIARQGRELVLAKHTYVHRLKEMLEILDQEPAVQPVEAVKSRPQICVMSPNEQFDVFGDRLAADHDADVVRDVPTPDTDLILALHPEMFGFAQVYKSMYPDATLVCLVWDVKKWLMYDPAFNPLFEITRAGLEMADVVWVPTEDVAEAVKDAFGAEAKVMPFWFNPLRRRRKASDGSVVFVGRFERHKRHDRILRELAGMNGDRPRVKLIGRNGETVEWLKELVKTLDVDVDFMVDATDEQMADAVVRAEAFINPSEHDGDGGQAVLQAHALGIPIKRTIQGEPYRPPQTLTGIKSATNRFMASFQQEGWL